LKPGEERPPPPNTPPPNKDEEEEGYFHRFSFRSEDPPMDKVLWVLSFPLLCIFTAFVPDCGHPKAEKYYVVTFIMSIGMMGGLCHVMVQFASYIGCIWNVDPFIMGTMVLVLHEFTDQVQIIDREHDGTAIGMAIANAVNRLRESEAKSKTIITTI
jgi:hypothetical protein